MVAFVSPSLGFQRRPRAVSCCPGTLNVLYSCLGTPYSLFSLGRPEQRLAWRGIVCHRTAPLRRVRVTSSRLDAGSASEVLQDVPEGVIKSVEKLSRQPRVTVADVAASAGLEIPVAQDALVSLASMTGAAIDVSDEGELAYRFPRNVRQKLRQKSARAALRMTWDRAFPALFTAVRVSFGAFLILSITLVFVAFVAISVSGSGQDSENERGGGGRSGGSRLYIGPRISDLFFPGPSYGPRGYKGGGYGEKTEEMSFLESVYSFVFGDGDPNAVLAQEGRWQKIAAVIRANNGAVVAEQVAPFLDLPKEHGNDEPGGRGEGSLIVDESFMLPVLQRFHGHPEVTDAGYLVYVFPEFGVTGSAGGRRGAAVELAGAQSVVPLKEKELELSRASTRQKLYSVGLGLLNVVGVVALGPALQNVRVIGGGGGAEAIIGFTRAMYPGLLIYASTYFLVPAMRFLWQRRRNRDIARRNRARQRAAARLARMSRGGADGKLRAAAEKGLASRVVSADSVIYSTDRDVRDQPALEREASRDFDRRLNGSGSGSGGGTPASGDM